VPLLLDENVPIAAVRALRAAGHDVFSASEDSSGAADEVSEVLVKLLARTDVVWSQRFSVVDRLYIRQRPL
jgi:Domain of unknown function (DUF5615)